MDAWIDEYEMDIELIMLACEKGKNASSPSIKYLNGIIKNYNNKNIKK